MLKFMRSVELHVLETDADCELAILAGLLNEIDDVVDIECTACFEDVGSLNGAYFPFAIVLTDEDQWFICTGCASNVLDGQEQTESLEDLFIIDEEFEPFDLDEDD